MSKAKNYIATANALAALETVLLGFLIFGAQVPGNYSNAYAAGNMAEAYGLVLFTTVPFTLCLIG